MAPTLRELIESNARLADSVLAASQSLTRLQPVLERLAKEVYDAKNESEAKSAHFTFIVTEVNKSLALVLDNVKEGAKDFRSLEREVTGAHLLQPQDHRTTAERVIDRVEKFPTSTKIWLLVVIIVITASGWLSHLLELFEH